MNSATESGPSRQHSTVSLVLWALLGLFMFRVAAQLLQAYAPVPWLPPFAAWQSGTLPYAWLLLAQAVLIVIMGLVTWRAGRESWARRPGLGAGILSLGSIYFGLMIFRLVAGYTFAAGRPFLGAHLPAWFHLVLSAWVLGVGLYHVAPTEPALRRVLLTWLAYPVLMAVCLGMYFALRAAGTGIFVSSYLPVAIGAGVITLLERFHPYRPAWTPERGEMRNDLAFMVTVQILLPKLLAFAIAVWGLHRLRAWGWTLDGWWPLTWPAVAQAALMLVLADLLRYWLHRASHEWSERLWRLHAVHHSPHKLYWVNVGRFHPLEKALQFLCDAAPFMLIGVSDEVLAIYFVFYAVNGFFQHSNANVRLGLLNLLISGPELHRWHHSWDPRESNKNYGNNIILWDLLFGTFFLPRDRGVGLLGLRNRSYPQDFARQLLTPFTRGVDQAPP